MSYAQKIKAVETRYNGYRFRSRLEARWAVFFDSLGISYAYEAETFDLGELGWYLPDFYLPKLVVQGVQGLYVEIKTSTVSADAYSKIEKLSSHTGRPATIVACDSVTNYSDDVVNGGHYIYNHYRDGGLCDYYLFCVCPRCNTTGFQFEARSNRIPCPCDRDDDKGYQCRPGSSKAIDDAVEVARSARFGAH